MGTRGYAGNLTNSTGATVIKAKHMDPARQIVKGGITISSPALVKVFLL